MDWREYCIEELDRYYCFVSAFHKSRFIKMYDRVKYLPFFTKGLCKCIFLAAWDQEHSQVMERMLDELTERKAQNLEYMVESGRRIQEEGQSNERILYELAEFFLTHPGETPDESCLMQLSRNWIPLGDSVLQASQVVDGL